MIYKILWRHIFSAECRFDIDEAKITKKLNIKKYITKMGVALLKRRIMRRVWDTDVTQYKRVAEEFV